MNAKYDLIVVGAGNLGTFHAFHALQAGKKVLMLEKDTMPVEATVRNFGQVVPSGQALDTWFEFGRTSLKIYDSIQQKVDISARQNGSYYFASDEDEVQLLEEAFSLFKERDYPAELLTSKRCFERIPSLQQSYGKAGLYFSQEFSVEPRLMVHRVREMLIRSYGLAYQNNTTVIACEEKQGLCEVRTATGEIFWSEKVAICNGRDFKSLMPEIFNQSGMLISKLNMMATVPISEVTLKGNILSGLSIRRYDSFKSCVSYSNLTQPEWQKPYQQWGIHLLFKQALDGSIIIGDSHEYASVQEAAHLDFSIDMAINDLILQEAKRILDLPTWQIQQYWAGYYAQTTDGGVYEYDQNKKIFISTGIGGKGMTTAPGYAQKRIAEIFD